jgi:hypothetical protein
MQFPSLPKGSIIPNPPIMEDLTDLKENEKLRKQHSHDWKIAIFNVLAGGVAGLITSIIFWLITK